MEIVTQKSHELRSASESIQPVQINLGRPKLELDSAHVKYGVVWTGPNSFNGNQMCHGV